MSLERHNSSNLPTILSDSFLRSYSLSRIVKINEENRNKAKVAIMRKIREIKQTSRDHRHPTQLHTIYQEKIPQSPTNIQALKEQLSIIDDAEGVDTSELRKKKPRKPCRNRKLLDSPQSNSIKNSVQHRRFKSTPQRESNCHKTKEVFFLTKDFNDQVAHSKMKALLRMNNLKFDPLSAKHNNQSNYPQQLDDPQSPLSTALNSFNRLKLMMNTKSSQNIMKHFYKRSLQNCTIDDIKYLIKMQGEKQRQHESPQNRQYLPMKFGKAPYLRKTFGEREDENASDKSEQKTVWKNEVLKRSCPNTEMNEKDHKNTSRIVPTKQLIHRNLRRRTSDTRHKYSTSPSNQNQQTEQMLNRITEKPADKEKDFMFCYQNKRFPMNQNKLNGIYKNWQKQHLRKRNWRQYQVGDSILEKPQNQSLITHNIKFKIPQRHDESVEQSTKVFQSQTSLMRNTSYEDQNHQHSQLINH